MIDMHTHILPGMDDGSESVEQSAKMLECMHRQGVKTVVATPHFDMRAESIDNFLDRRQKAMQKLLDAGIDVSGLVLGAEVLYCGIGISRMEGIERLCVGEGRYLLIETEFGRWTDSFATDLRQLMAEQNIIPILAHAERYIRDRKNRKVFCQLQNSGIVVQSNAEFFLQKRSHRQAFRLLREDAIQILGSDCHNLEMRRPNLFEAAQVMEKHGEGERLRRMMEHAEMILAGQSL